MKKHLTPHRRAAVWLLAAAALPATPLAAQDAPVINAPPPVVSAPAPAPAPTPSLNVTTPRPTLNLPPRATLAPAPTAARAAPAQRAVRAAPRAAAPVRQAVRAAPAPVAEPIPVETPAPVGAAAAPALAPPPAAEVAPAPVAPAAAPAARAYWPWLAGGALLLAAIAFFALRRRRGDADEAEEVYYEEPAYAAPEPSFVPAAAAVPMAAAVSARDDEDIEPVAPPEEIHIAASEPADIEALAATSEPEANRPWLEFLMRPLRAGTSRDNTIVEFELTVGNTGSVPARDVRISTWVVAAGEATEMERMLIDPPADTHVEEMDIAAGEGARVDARIGLSKDGLNESVLPVVHADARYTLADGSEGRTHASFAVGVPEGEELRPFLTDRSGIRENVEARLFGEPEHV
jgi:hypothetical protein